MIELLPLYNKIIKQPLKTQSLFVCLVKFQFFKWFLFLFIKTVGKI